MNDIALHVDQQRTPGLIGASDAAAILGLSQYDSPLSKWLELRGGECKERPAFVREAAEWGQALEPVVRGRYALATNTMIVVPEESRVLDGWLRCTPDGFVYSTGRTGRTFVESDCGRDDDPDGLLQVKTCSAYLADDWESGPPPAYEVQCRVEMAVCDLPWNDIICLVGGQHLVGPFRIHRDMAIEERILRDLKAFNERVLAGIEPDPDASHAWKEYASSKMRPSKVAIQADDATKAALAELRDARRIEKEAKAKADAAKTRVLLSMSAAGATKILVDGKPAVTAYQTGGRTDWKGYAESLSDAPPHAQFVKPSSTWAIKLLGDDE